MNPERDRALLELTRRNPFWVCLLVFGLLAVDTAFRLSNSVRQRKQLEKAHLAQAQDVGRLQPTLAQLPQLEARLQALSLDLLEVSKTNAAADQIVREFNIQWNPGPGALPAMAAPPTPASAVAPEAASAAGSPAAATPSPATNAPLAP